MSKNTSTFVPDISRLQQIDYQSIVQTLITRTDTIWLQSMVMDVNSQETIKNLSGLIEAGLIELWDYELRLGRGSIQPKRVITLEEHNEAEQYKNLLVDEMLRSSSEMHASDYTTLNIEKKNMITNQLLAHYCDANSLLQRFPHVNSIVSRNEQKTDILNLYTTHLFGVTNISQLQNLSVDDILELRKLSKHLRVAIQKCIDKHLLQTNIPEELIRQDCQDLHRQYDELIREAIEEKYSNRSIIRDTTIETLSLVAGWTSFISIPKKIIESILNRKERGFVIYMTRLGNAIQREKTQ